MSNIVEFVLKLKNLVSGGMADIARTSKRADDSIAGVQKKLDGLAKPTRISIDTSDVTKATRQMERLRDEHGRLAAGAGRRAGGSSGVFGMLGMSRLAAGGLVGATALAAGTGYSIGQALTGSQQKASFEVLAGQQQGGKLYGDITKFAQDSIFGNELYKNAQTLLSFGIDAKKIMPDLKMLGDVSMGDAEKLGSLALAFSQVQSAGRLTGQDLLQFVNAGFNPLKEISDMTGRSMMDLKKTMEKGAISANAVEIAFQHATGPAGKFYQMTDKIADTPFGKWEAFKGQIQGLALQFGTALFPAVSKVLDVLPPLLTSVTPMLMKLVPIFTSIANIANTLLVPALKIVGGVLNTVLDIVGPVIKGVEYIVQKIVGLFDDGRIEDAYQDAGELSGKNYVSGVAQEVKGIKDIVSNPVNDSKVAKAYKDAAADNGKTYMEALKEKMETFDLTVPIKLITDPRSSFGAIGNMVVDQNGQLAWDKPKMQDVKDTPHGKSLFDAYFGTGNYAYKPTNNIKLAGDWSQSYTPKTRKISEQAIKLAPSMLNYYGVGYTGNPGAVPATKQGVTNLDKLLGGPGSDSSSKAIAGGGHKQIIINVNKEFNSGGIHINTHSTDAGINDVEHRMEEMWLRMLQSANAVDDN